MSSTKKPVAPSGISQSSVVEALSENSLVAGVTVIDTVSNTTLGISAGKSISGSNSSIIRDRLTLVALTVRVRALVSSILTVTSVPNSDALPNNLPLKFPSFSLPIKRVRL